MVEDVKNPTNKRIENAEKRMAEAKKREAESYSKVWGGVIEKIERIRKTPQVKSLQNRIDKHIEIINLVYRALLKMKEFDFTETEKSSVDALLDTYKSIREDFKYVMKITDENFNKLFPERKIDFKVRHEAMMILFGIMEQERQMSIFLERKLNP